MDRDELLRRLMGTFLEEADEHVGALGEDLLAVERGATGAEREELLKRLFRSAHSLKGAARAVSVELVETACHDLETILGDVREGKRELAGDLLEVCLRATDALAATVPLLRDGKELGGTELQQLVPLVEAAARGEAVELPGPEESAPHSGDAPAAAPITSVRVATEKLDALLARSGELVVARRRMESRCADADSLHALAAACAARFHAGASREAAADALARELAELKAGLGQLAGDLLADASTLQQAAQPLHEEIHRVLMVPVGEACAGLERAARDAAVQAGKEVTLSIEGSRVELDRSIVEGLKAPLLHLVRNAVVHGVESPEERKRAGKPSGGRVEVTARLAGDGVEIKVSDDGRGLDLESLRAEAERRGQRIVADEDLVALIFEHGVSTQETVTELAGRGVGLDVVRTQVEALHGRLDVSWRPGEGAGFELRLPLTVTTIRALLVRLGEEILAFACAAVEQLVSVPRSELKLAGGRRVLSLDGKLVRVARLGSVLDLPSEVADSGNEGTTVSLAVLTSAGGRAAVEVDELLTEDDVVVGGLGSRLSGLRFVSGATMLETGRVALILNASEVVREALQLERDDVRAAPVPVERKRILVADDSVTVRSLQQATLEAAGFDVQLAVDGVEAWSLLQAHGADLVISDVEMPRMDGLELTRRIRGSESFRGLPVILVTALASDEHRKRGVEVGADAYLVKSSFEQESLLETIDGLI